MSLTVQVTISEGLLAFELSPPIGFDFLVVSDSNHHVFWELKPTSMQPAPIIAEDFYSVAVSPDTAAKMMALTKTALDNPPVARVVYGVVPQGYREVVSATALQSGETYCIFIFGDGPERAWEYFHI